MRLQQKCAVQKNRKFSICAEMQPTATAACVKSSSCETALKACLHWRHSSKRAAVRDVFKSRVSAYPGFENVTPGGLKK